MKKIIMMAVMAVAAVSANAQSWVGGSLGFSNSKVDGAESSVTQFEIKPEVGYSLNENWDVALGVGYSFNNESVNTNAFEINPYVRYKFVKAGNFYAFCDGGLTYMTTHKQGAEKNMNVFGVGFNPGIGYDLTEKVFLVAHIGDLSYAHGWQGDFKTNAFNLSLTSNISFGAYVKF
ncbi:MAG: outer membrane beta-barrel protein [Prevotellaceae bacterium]|nr:outer membrane beta-barrel protein [Prevotellaceae bacterium]MDY2749223.1 outer membrane beta-barrel protein [Prevotella sp.]